MNLAEAVQAVLAFCEGDGVFLSDDLTKIEDAVLTAVRRIGARAVELQMARQKLGYEGPRRPCSCGHAQHFVSHPLKIIATQMGEIRLSRAYCHCNSASPPARGRRRDLVREPDAVNPPVGFDERYVETEHGTARDAPANERAGNG